jgi:pilus assembly protein CpaB
MNQKIIPIVSIVAGFAAFVLTGKYLRDKDAEIENMKNELLRSARTVPVVAARVDIPSGTTIKTSDLDLIHMVEATLPDQVIRKDDAKMILGKKTVFQVPAKHAFQWTDIEGNPAAGRGLSTMVTPGQRALSIAVSGASAVSGMVEPDDHVDVLGTFSFPSKTVVGEMETVTLTILQDVTVLATGQDISKSYASRRTPARNTSYSTITLAVWPREAELLVFAQQVQGRLTLALRNSSDVSFQKEMPQVDFKLLESELPNLNQERQNNIRAKGNL